MPFKTTVNKQRDIVELAASAEKLAPEVTAIFNRNLAPYLREGEVMPDVGLLQELIGRFLEASGDQLLEVDNRYTAEVRTNQQLRTRREALIEELRGRLRDIRYLIDRRFGLEASKQLMPVRDLYQYSARELVQAGRQVITVLRDPQYALDQAHANGLLANAQALADALELECSELAELLNRQLAGQKRDKQSGLKQKLAEIKTATEAARRSADFLAGIYRLAGLDFHAERLRPALRRRKPQSTDEEEKKDGEAKASGATPEVVTSPTN